MLASHNCLYAGRALSCTNSSQYPAVPKPSHQRLQVHSPRDPSVRKHSLSEVQSDPLTTGFPRCISTGGTLAHAAVRGSTWLVLHRVGSLLSSPLSRVYCRKHVGLSKSKLQRCPRMHSPGCWPWHLWPRGNWGVQTLKKQNHPGTQSMSAPSSRGAHGSPVVRPWQRSRKQFFWPYMQS